MTAVRERCLTCGFAPTTVGPTDAALTARSLPRRYRDVLARPDDDESPEEPASRRPPDGSLSALEHAALAAEVLSLTALALGRLAVEDEPEVSLVAPEPGPQWSTEVVLVRLAGAATHLAEAIEALRGEAWARPCTLDEDGQVTALDVARAGVHAGVHHLRDARRVIEQVRVS